MSSPISHLACAYMAYSAVAARNPSARGVSCGRALAAAAFFSLAPDLDYGLAWIGGNIEAYHNQFTHSLLVVIGFGCLAVVSLRMVRPSLHAGTLFLLAAACGLMHLAVDYFTQGRGVMLLWPWSEHRFISPFPFFQGVRWNEGWISPSHLRTLAQDTLFAVVVVGMVRIWLNRRARAHL